MAQQIYNPLLKLGLQELQDIPEPPEPITVDDKLSPTSTNPVQNKVITAKLTEMEQDTSKKVSKFFTSIEELQFDEIGEFQGEPGGDFVPGYFYKRNNPSNIEYLSDTINIQGNTYLELKEKIADEYVLKYRQYYKGVVDLPYETIQVYGNDTIRVLLFSPNFFVGSTLIYDGNHANGYCVFPYAIICNEASHNSRFDFNNPIRVQNGVFYYKGQALEGDWGGGMSGCPVGVSIEEPNIYYIWCYTSYWSYFPILVNSTLDKGAFVTDLSLQCVDNWSTPYGSQYNIDILDYAFTANAPFIRVDTQPSLDPSSFATSEQGAKADTALQSISKGTDGNYITTTVGTKDSNNKQTVGASLTIQDIATADSTHKGLAEASNVKTYAATAAQGAKADTALQSIDKGTDGDYITTTVTAKDVNNQQTVGVSAKIQGISTADSSNKGILEASDTKNYIDKQIYDVSCNFQFYGVQWDTADPSPDCTRIGNMSLHAELPIQNSIIGGLLQDDLTFTPFPDQSDWSGETLDGSEGQVVVRIPSFYWKFETHGTINKILISEYPVPGFIQTPLIYVGTQKATVDRSDPTTPKLCSVVNTTVNFRGGNNNAEWDGTYRSLLGFPATQLSLTQFRQYARNRAAGTAFNCQMYTATMILYWLFVVEYATLNSQKAYNAAKDVNGYMQGGLGPGVSDWNADSWYAYNQHNPLIPCGYLVEYGNRSAVKNYNVIDGNGNILHTFAVNSYRGIQSVFGDIWDWVDGILINVQAADAGGLSTCYVTDDPAKFSSSDFSQYRLVGNTPRADNWIKSIFFNEHGDIICKTQPGSSTSYYCDFYWGANLPSSGISLRGVSFGGRANNGAVCGFLCSFSHNVPAYVSPDLGSRLCAIPPP